ncbi:MAG TPA: DUF2341 domain-containing protein [Chitinispirillaceae bacterium]|nr:DUF2341 domain-containing protein [Chitinispirillaceae bacterium]
MKLQAESILRICICLVMSFMTLCSDSTPVSQGGGGSEVEVVGFVRAPDSTPALLTQIKLIPQGYDAFTDGAIGDSMIDTTNANGFYVIKNVTPGNYNVQAVQLNNRTRMLITDVKVAGDTTRIRDGLLAQPGTIRLVLGKMDKGHVAIPGTDIAVPADVNSSEIIIDSVPSGAIPCINMISNSTAVYILTDVDVKPGDTTTIVNPHWTGHQEIVLNTTASGADIQDTVVDFPVLIRLNSGNFDFSKAAGNGDDLRFTTSDGKPLVYEIEKWDSVSQQAAIWVKVDTIPGNNSDQFIIMHWGNPQAVSISNSIEVFDTAAGFAGVWHLADASVNISDATINNYAGKSPDTARPSVVDGIIGDCRMFDGIDDFISMPNTAASTLNFPESGNFTVSAWVNVDTLDGESRLVVAKGYDQYFLRLTYFPTGAPLWEFTEFNNDDSWQTCTTTTRSGNWILLAGVRKENQQILYINGVPIDSTPDTYKGNNLKRSTASDISIGKLLGLIELPNGTQGYCYFKGSIDEVRIDTRARSAAWMKLCYMNQQLNNKFIDFK